MPTAREVARRGRPRTYDGEALIAVARRLGPDHLSLTTVANELGVPRTTLYNALNGRLSLGQLVLSSILDESSRGAEPLPTDMPWLGQLEDFADGERESLLAAGPWLRFYDPAIHITTARLRAADRLLGLMVHDGVPIERAAHALALVTQVVQQSVLRFVHVPWGSPDASGAVIDALDPADYPSLTAAKAAFAPEVFDESQYRFALGCVLAGIAALVG